MDEHSKRSDVRLEAERLAAELRAGKPLGSEPRPDFNPEDVAREAFETFVDRGIDPTANFIAFWKKIGDESKTQIGNRKIQPVTALTRGEYFDLVKSATLGYNAVRGLEKASRSRDKATVIFKSVMLRVEERTGLDSFWLESHQAIVANDEKNFEGLKEDHFASVVNPGEGDLFGTLVKLITGKGR